MPATSSQTTAGGSDAPSRRALTAQIGIPATHTAAVTAAIAGRPRGEAASARPAPSPTTLPAVPGARGA